MKVLVGRAKGRVKWTLECHRKVEPFKVLKVFKVRRSKVRIKK